MCVCVCVCVCVHATVSEGSTLISRPSPSSDSRTGWREGGALQEGRRAAVPGPNVFQEALPRASYARTCDGDGLVLFFIWRYSV